MREGEEGGWEERERHAPQPLSSPSSPSSPPQPDRIAVALGALGAGAATGAALVTVCLALLRQQLGTTLPLILFFGIVAAVATAWSLAGAVDDTWRRAVTATLAAFAGLMLTGLAAPADMIGGQAGLFVYAILLGVGAGYAARCARRAGSL